MALRNPCFKDQTGLICEGSKNGREREGRGKKRRRGRERRWRSQGMDAWILVWNYMVLYGFLV